MSFESITLPAEHVDALNAANVRIYGGNHGKFENVAPYGNACLGVMDSDYRGVEKIVNSLKPGRDILTVEGYQHGGAEHDQKWFLKTVMPIFENSPLTDYGLTDLYEIAKQMRDSWVFSPMDYGFCLALARGVRTEFTDATLAELKAWWVDRQRQGKDRPPDILEEARFRDTRIVARLGAIAVSIDRTGFRWPTRPTIATIVGENHPPHLRRLLNTNGIRGVKAHGFSPSRRDRDKEIIKLEIANYDRAVSDPNWANRELWTRHAKGLLVKRHRTK